MLTLGCFILYIFYKAIHTWNLTSKCQTGLQANQNMCNFKCIISEKLNVNAYCICHIEELANIKNKIPPQIKRCQVKLWQGGVVNSCYFSFYRYIYLASYLCVIPNKENSCMHLVMRAV